MAQWLLMPADRAAAGSPASRGSPADPTLSGQHAERGAPQRRPWTFLVYMAGDNGRLFDTELGKVKLMVEMTTAGFRDLAEMSQVGTTPNVAVVCLFDTTTASYLVEVRSGRGFDDCRVQRIAEVNTGSAESLSRFVLESARRYPSDRIALVLWNHGTGWVDRDPYESVRDGSRATQLFRHEGNQPPRHGTRPIGFDDTARDALDALDLRLALDAIMRGLGRPLDLIGMDACLMAAVEGAREVAPYAEFFVASQEVEPMDGWPYDRILAALDGRPEMPAADLAQAVIREYASAYSGRTRQEETVTQSGIRLARTTETEYLCRALVDAIMENRQDQRLRALVAQARNATLAFSDRTYRDLGDFAVKLADATEHTPYRAVQATAKVLHGHLTSRREDAPILRVAYRPGYQRATGLSVYLPGLQTPIEGIRSDLAAYATLQFARYTGWDRLIGWLAGETAQGGGAENGTPTTIFRADRAAQTLSAVLTAVSNAWPELRQPVRERIAAIVRVHGYRVGNYRAADRHNVVVCVTDLLADLDSLREQLPTTVVRSLEAGAQHVEPGSARGPVLVSISDDAREGLLRQMEGIAEFRTFAEPEQLRAKVDALVKQHYDRLTPSERERWAALAVRYPPGRDGDALLHEAEALLGDYPEVRDAFSAHRMPGAGAALRSMSPGRTQAREPQATELPASERSASIDFPERVLADQSRVPLVVEIKSLPGHQAAVGRKPGALRASPGDVVIALQAEDLLVEHAVGGAPLGQNSAARTIRLEPGHDSGPVVFYLTPQTSGVKRITVDFYQLGRNLLSLAMDTVVLPVGGSIKRLRSAGPRDVAFAQPSRGKRAPAPDLELRITLSGDRRSLHYTLHSPGSSRYNFMPVGQVQLGHDPQTYLRSLYDRLGGLARRSARRSDPARANRELASIGQNLYADLFSAELKREYALLRREAGAFVGRNLVITTDDPWIPWELAKPYGPEADGGASFDDPYLCETFCVSRWLAGRGAPDRMVIRSGAWVVPPSDLGASSAESDFFAGLHRRRWSVKLHGPLTSLVEVEQQLATGQLGLLHFAGHGSFDADNPDASRVALSDGFFTPSLLSPQLATGVRRGQPLVFLNACHSGRAAPGLTRLGGWAQRLIEAGAGAFIGTLWEVDDELAAKFAQEFYSRLWGLGGGVPLPLGRAFQEARLAVREAGPTNSTWLAYVLFGDPACEVVLGDAEATA
jgi:hypothetical protein